MNLIGKEYTGEIYPGEDPKNRGRYEVKIDELCTHLPEGENTIYCVNHVHKYRDSQTSDESAIEGEYLPLHPGTRVIVKFFKQDYNSGYIDRVVSDYYEDSLPLELETINRDQYYQLLRTIKNDLLSMTMDTQNPNVPANGIHLYFREDRTMMIIDEKGFHLYSEDYFDMQFEKFGHISIGEKLDIIVTDDMSIKVGGNTNLSIDGNCNISVNGSVNLSTNSTCNVESSGDMNIKTSSKCNIQSSGDMNIKASSKCNVESSSNTNIKGRSINIDGSSMIYLNSKKAGSAGSASSPDKPTEPQPLQKTEHIKMNKPKTIKLKI